jgi:hypothetical protein
MEKLTIPINSVSHLAVVGSSWLSGRRIDRYYVLLTHNILEDWLCTRLAAAPVILQSLRRSASILLKVKVLWHMMIFKKKERCVQSACFFNGSTSGLLLKASNPGRYFHQEFW